MADDPSPLAALRSLALPQAGLGRAPCHRRATESRSDEVARASSAIRALTSGSRYFAYRRLAIALLVPGLGHAGAWTLGPGHSYARLGYGYYAAGSRFDSGGERLGLSDAAFLGEGFGALVTEGSVRAHAVRLYAEGGVARRLDVFGKIAFLDSQTRYRCGPASAPQVCDLDQQVSPSAATSVEMGNRGFGDVEVGAKAGLLEAPVVVSFALSVALPTYSNDRDVLRVTDENLFNDRTPLGSGSVDVEGRALAGVSLGRGWIGVEAGLRARTAGFADLATYVVQGGHPLAWRVSGALAVGGFVGVGSGSRGDAHEPPQDDEVTGPGKVIYPSNEEAHQALPSLALDLGRGIALEMGGQWTYAGRRTNAGWGFDTAVSWKR